MRARRLRGLSGLLLRRRRRRAAADAPGVLGLHFEPLAEYRPFSIVAPGFEQVDQPAAGATAGLRRSGISPTAPFAAIEAEVTDLTDRFAFGLAGDATDPAAAQLLAVYDAHRGRLQLQLQCDGDTHTVADESVQLSAPCRLAFVLCENQVTVLAEDGAGQWSALLTERDRVGELIDLRDPATLHGLSYAWGAPVDAAPAQLGQVRAGPFGYTGLRDLHLVQYDDGRPYVRDGQAYLTATCAGMGFFHAAHWGVFTLDLADSTSLRQVAQLYSRRDGLLLGDHAGQIVVEDSSGRCLVGVSAWGDFGSPGSQVHVRQATTTIDVLSGVHVLDTEPVALPTDVGAWDPAITRIDDRWHVAFVESPSQGDPFDFHPALAVGPAGGEPFADLELVGADTDLEQCEGPILQRVGDDWSLLASDGRHRAYLAYDLAMQRRGGRLDAPYGSNIPHPQLVPLSDGGWWLVTFDGDQFAEKQLGYGTHGDVVVMRAEP